MAKEPKTTETEEKTEAEPMAPILQARRNAVLDDIVAHRHEQLRDEGMEIGDPAPEDPPQEAEEAAAAPAEPDPAPAEGEEASPTEGAAEQAAEGEGESDGGTAVAAEDDKDLIEVVVDGETRKVTHEELVRGYAIESSARSRLEQANRALRDIQEYEANLKRQTPEEAGADTQTGADPAPGQESPAGPDWGHVVDRIQYGDKDEATEALQEAVARYAGAQSAPTEVDASKIEQNVLNSIAWNEALKKFGEDHKDILSDPQLARMAGDTARELYDMAVQDSVNSGAPMPSYADILDAAGEATKRFVIKTAERFGVGGTDSNEPAPAPNGSPAIDIDRSAEKRSATPPKPRAVNPVAPPAQQPTEPTELERHQAGIQEILANRQRRYNVNR